MDRTKRDEYVEYVRARLPRLHRTAWLICGDPHLADGAVQATLAVLYSTWRHASTVENLDGYVHRILTRRIADERRSRWSQVSLRASPPDRAGEPGDPGEIPKATSHGTRQSRADVPSAGSTRPSSTPTPTRVPANVAGIALRCPVTTLAKPPGVGGVQIDAVDPSGRYVGGQVVNTSSTFTSVLWTDGVPKVLHFADSVQIVSINSSGVVVGLAYTGSTEWDFRYFNGAVSHLTVPAGMYAFGNPTVNAHGDTADTMEPADEQGEGGAHDKGLVWKAGSTSPTVVPLTTQGNVVAITDDNRLLGYIGDGQTRSTGWITDGRQVVYRPDGTPVRMDPPVRGDTVVTAGVTDSGDVFGTYYATAPGTTGATDGKNTPAVWHCGSAS